MRLKNFSLYYGTQVFKAFADESRTRILHLLYRAEELTITDIEYILEFTQSKTSRHVSFLRNSGLVNIRKIDQWVFYSIKDEVSEMVTTLMEFLLKDPTLQNDEETFKILNSNRELSVHKLAAKVLKR